MKILIIGGTSSLSLALKPVLGNIGEVLTAGRKDSDIDFDLNDAIDIEKFPEDIDIVIHTVAYFGENSFIDIEQSIQTNVLGILRVCEIVKQLNIKQFIFISSVSAELHYTSQFYNAYALSKKQSEDVANFYCLEHNINLTILRPSQIYGDSTDFVKHQPFLYHIIEKAKNDETVSIYGSNDASRNYIFIDDLTAILEKVIETRVVGTYYCGSMSDITYSQIAKAAYSAFKHTEKIVFLSEKNDIPSKIYNKDDSLYKKIDFYPQVSMESGMKKIAKVIQG